MFKSSYKGSGNIYEVSAGRGSPIATKTFYNPHRIFGKTVGTLGIDRDVKWRLEVSLVRILYRLL